MNFGNVTEKVLSAEVVGINGDSTTIQKELVDIGEDIEDALFKVSSDGRIKKFLAWTDNYVVVLVHSGFFSFLDRIPRNPPSRSPNV